jgi:glucokinase
MPPRDAHLLGLDVGGTKLSAVVADAEGRILATERRPTRSERGVRPIVDDAVAMLRGVAARAGVRWEDARGLGVSFGGPLDATRGIVYSPANLPGWDAVPLLDLLEEAFPGVRIVMDNDANAAAAAEWRFGAARGFANVLYVTMGTGIGGGVIADGRLVRGANGAAGEIGHICLVPDGPTCGCGRRGCLEALCSGPAIARRAREKLAAGMDGGDLLRAANVPPDELRTEHLLDAARRGNAFAVEHFQETAYFMAWGVGAALNLLNPEIVVLGTVATAAGELFLAPLRQHVRRFAMARSADAVRIVPAALGDQVGDYAAISLLLD